MAITNSIVNFRRFLKRRNYSAHTVDNYLYSLRQFVLWTKVPIEQISPREISDYIDHLRERGLEPKTINCHVNRIKQFYDYLREQERVCTVSPVNRRHNLRLPKPLPRHLSDAQAKAFLEVPKHPRDQAMFLLMLRCGMRVEEVAKLLMDAIDFKRRRILIQNGKWGKARVVCISNDALKALVAYLRVRPSSRTRKVFLVEKGTYTGRPISVRGIKKRIEYYAKKYRLTVSCHQLRHTMATQLLNAGAELVAIQDLLGHSSITTTQRYSWVSNLKVERDYHTAMQLVMQRSACNPLSA
jgi:site-specific recombinase XerD